ncbi:MAG: exodeoxyribonuclease V subunit beta [Deltaproteobacteria bacterium]|nr:exodeoxyribonuclease V subunit beta [Deltaproteobacteria bacterium]
MKDNFLPFDTGGGVLAKGVNLVEASAGTGKTYAIAMIVLRAVVELGVGIEKILIVTFTRAATEELKGRIRTRLVEGRDILEGKGQSPDRTLTDWAAAVADKKTALRRLQLALYEIDRAGIFTIHGFCQRMLAEQALESGQLFDVELLTDIRPVQAEIVDDFWRNHIYPLEALPCSIFMESFATPEELMKSVIGPGKGAGKIQPAAGRIDDALSSLKLGFKAMSAWWRKNGLLLLDQLEAIKEEKGFKKAFSDGFEVWCRSLDIFFQTSGEGIPTGLHLLKRDEIFKELNGNTYRGDSKKIRALAGCTFPGREIDLFLQACDQLLLTLRVQLAGELQREVGRRLSQRSSLSFDDLISRLSGALHGRAGKRLKDVIRQRFQVALIDEFQDTDSSQWYIFSELFAQKSHYLYLIGDPKQAIYKFRGADIHSYFRARSVADHFLTLGKNYRSHPFLIQEVNRLFTSRPDPFFLEEECIDFYPVEAAKTGDDMDLLENGQSLAGMVYCLLPENSGSRDGRWAIGEGSAAFRLFVVAEISRLLDPDVPVIIKEKKDRPLRPRDIAILVRTNRQASDYLGDFLDAGIPAVISSRESVFNSEECGDLLILLRAVAQPGDLSLLKTAMTLRWFGFNGGELVILWRDEERLGQWYERFLIYNSLWQEEGFMVMMSRLIVDEDVYPVLSRQRGTERSITNIQHLIEMIQEAEVTEQLQIGQTLLWLQRMTDSAWSVQESGELRLESDEEAVQIITMHGAKGLEFPVVFCPALWYRSNRLAREKYCIAGHDQEGNIIIDLGSEMFEIYRQKGVDEEMAEDLRLLYVALTRAGIRCYVMWGDIKGRGIVGDSFESALGYMVFPEGPCSAGEQRETLEKLSISPAVHFVLLERDTPPPVYRQKVCRHDLQPEHPSGRELHTDWQVSSYSSMTSLSDYEDELPAPIGKDESGGTIPVTGLPAGPNFGNMVHDLLESVPFSEFAASEGTGAVPADAGRKYGVAVKSDPLYQLLRNIVTTPLPLPTGSSVSLASLSESSCLKEMEFYFRMSRLETEQINRILSTDPAVCRLSHRVMEGYLTGFIDLIYEYGGRYYILDYKTNYLGNGMEDYRKENLFRSMRSHNYGLQFWIYTLVLHRHLQNVVGDYSYKDHFGGVFYLFVRGMHPDHPGNGVFTALPDFERLSALEQIFGGIDGE